MDPDIRPTIVDFPVLDRRRSAPLQRQLYEELKRLVGRGTWPPGRLLPSTRALAEDLGVSRNTVNAVYDRLVDEGYAESIPRRGLRVSMSVAMSRQGRRAASASPHPTPRARDTVADALMGATPFRPNQPDVRLFPLAIWNRLRARRLRGAGAGILNYQSTHTLGLAELRRVLADYLRESRGVRCDWRQIAVTSGSQFALFLLAQTLLQPGSRVLMEDPGYPGARRTWLQRGAVVDGTPVDEHGAQVPTIGTATVPSLVYLTPARQHPTGVSLPLARRLAWLDFAARTGAWLIEDDYDSELRYGLSPLPSLQGLDTSDRVIFVGSMSKLLFPSLRIGYAVLPTSLVDRVEALRAVVDDHGPLIDQLTLATFIESGAFARHIRRCRRAYHERQGALLETARRRGLPLQLTPADGGMNVVGRLAMDRSDERVSAALRERGFDVPALSQFTTRQLSPALVLGYTAFTVPELERHVGRLAKAMNALPPL